MQGSPHHTATIHARKLLGDHRVVAFLKAAHSRTDLMAIDLANGFLSDGMAVDFILSPPEGGSAGFTLFAHYVSSNVAQIEFALWTDRKKRSSGCWEVKFDQDDVVTNFIDLEERPKTVPSSKLIALTA